MKIVFHAAATAVLCVAAGCTTYVKPMPVAVESKSTLPNLASRSPKMTTLSTVTIDVPIGTALGEARYGWGGSCSNPSPVTHMKGTVQPNVQFYHPVFKDVMGEIGVPTQQVAQRFEGEEIRKADLQLAATITEMVINLCYPKLGEDKYYAKGQAYARIEWAVFSPVEKAVILSAVTTGSTAPSIESRLGEGGLIREAFRDALHKLVVKDEFVSALTQPRAASPALQTLELPQPARQQGAISELMPTIRDSVVTVRTNAGEGTGFAIGDGTYVLTAAHVVAGGGAVKLLGSGSEAVYGDVVRKDMGRDVALLKLQTGSLRPLHLSAAPVREGDDIYAVGSPLGQKFESSLTRGVVSSMRKYEGREYIQSDVNVLPGSSGGPLLDAHGNAVGVTSSGIGIDGVPVGLNLFVPVSSLMESLALVTKAPAAKP